MKYTYAYKTSDGVRHEAAMVADSREEVFALLRKRGIKAIKVVATDGSKANGEVRGKWKRHMAALTLAAAVLAAAAFAYVSLTREVKAGVATESPRHQIYGDPAIMEALEHGKTSDVLSRPGDRLLAYFAQPGKLMCPKALTRRELRRLTDAQVAEIKAVVTGDLRFAAAEPREAVELKQIVNGIRTELREYLANGNGTIRSFWRRLHERTQSETQIYERIKRELEKETNSAVWEQKNEALRNLGLRTIPTPQEAE